MTQEGPYLYDEGPEQLHTGPGRSRRGLLAVVLLGTVLLAVAAVIALPLITGTAGQQSTQAAGVFLAALRQGDTDTAYDLLCNDERARLKPEQVAAAYLQPGTPTVGTASETDLDGTRAERVAVRWTDGGAVTRTFLVLVNEGGAHVCGTTTDG
jgi:hypothetical protein